MSTPRTRHPGYSLRAAAAASQPPSDLWHRIHHHGGQISSETTSLQLLARPEDERRCIASFWEAYFPDGRPIPAGAVRSYTCTWTETARKLFGEEECLRHALWANCLLVTGNREGVEWMLKKAAVMYGKALSGLRASLGTAHGARRNSVVATVKLLEVFEVCGSPASIGAGTDAKRLQAFSRRTDSGETPDRSTSWGQHHAGELALFLSRTPVAHIDGDAHHVFADERVEMVSTPSCPAGRNERRTPPHSLSPQALSAILQRKRLPLSTPEWKSVPWQNIPKNMKDILADVLVEMPGLLEDLDNMLCLPSESSAQTTSRRDLIRKCWEYDAQLLSWLGLLSNIAQPPEHHDPCPEPENHSGESKSDLVTHVAQVHGMSLFWLTSMVLYSILRAVSGPEDVLTERTNPMHHARKLVEAIGILMRPESGLYGKQSAALQIEIAWRYATELGGSSGEGGDLLEALERLRGDLDRGLVATREGTKAGSGDVGLGIGMEAMKGKESMEI